VVDALCGPGWSFPEPEQGVWSDGPEARLLVPCRGGQTVEIEVELLARFGGPRRTVHVRLDGRPMQALVAPDQPDWPQVITLPIPATNGRETVAEISFQVHHPGRPADLGVNADTRRLGVLVRRVRVR
jgi:hypothetical protein